MYSILLLIIYISFISLGLPDALLGSAWPAMYGGFGVPVSYAGIITMIISGGTIVSSLFSHKLIRKLGTGKVTAVSVCFTAIALFGFSISHSFILLCLFAIPYGLGAGSVDAALNNFVALHYKASHMNWLHCFWGVGATMGPYVMGYFLTRGGTWNQGYRTIFFLQMGLTVLLFFSVPFWKKLDSANDENQEIHKTPNLLELLKMPGTKAILIAFFCYCGLEQTTGLWGASYMVMHRGMTVESAAKWAAFFYLGITFGRFVSGFVSIKLGSKMMIRIGQMITLIGILLVIIPVGTYLMCAGFILIGIGCAPIYPSLLHETPENFGKESSQAIMGMQMACAYIGSTFVPPLFGLVAEWIHIKWYPVFLSVFALGMLIMVEKLNLIHKKGRGENGN